MNQARDEAPAINSEVFLVGDLHVDIGQQRVARGGTEIILPNLSFQMMVALIRGAPDVLSYDTLMARVWPGLVVNQETVNKRATLLREALGDDAREPRYITAVRSRGYRLIADVQHVERLAPIRARAAEIGTGDATDVPARLGRGKWAGILVAAVTVLAVALLGRAIIKGRDLVAAVPEENSPGASTPIITRTRTVAVLPFENISAHTADAYLARGLPEMVLDRLSRVTGLAVIARNSSFALNTTSIDSQEIGRRLNSGYLVNGSVQRNADRLRVGVQLVDTTAGTLIWSAKFDRTLSDIFTVEDEIADQVTGALSARLGGLQPTPVVQMRSANIEAYLAYLQGRTLLGRRTVAGSDAAVPYFEKAVALDPNFAAAYASLYDSRLQAAYMHGENLAPLRQQFRPLIDRALAMDPKSGAAYFARAIWAEGPDNARDADFRRGAALDPSNGRGLTAYAEFLDNEDFWWVLGQGADPNRPVRREEAKRVLQRALQIDPMSPAAHFDAATGAFEVGGAAALEQNMIAVMELDPEYVPALNQVGKYRWTFHGKLADAVQVLERAIALDPRNPEPRGIAMAVYLDLGDEQAARAVMVLPKGARDPRLLLMHAGDWRAAGRDAYDSGAIYDCASWLGNQAVRDYALKTGDLARAIALIKANNYFEGDPAAHLEVCNSEAAIVLSQLLAAQGHASEAQALRGAAVSWISANRAKYAGTMRRSLAEALMLDGHRDEALDTLAEDFRTGDYQFWWYTLKYDPIWSPLHGDPRFQAMAVDVQRYVDNQRSALAEMRRRGTVPSAARPGESARKPAAG
jgi:TolB-like protein/DNA-binding winged helix-turn-helix (wHTH) protein/Tfp pilus assembly protein PilF